MKKRGFTLAEVIITLGIIGVVAALTTPALYHNVATADIGPKLAKFRATVDEANKLMLIENDVNRLSVLIAMHSNDPDYYTNQLRNFMHLDMSNGYEIQGYTGTDTIGSVNVSIAQGADPREVDFSGNTPFNFRTVEGMSVHFDIFENINFNSQSVGIVLVDINGNAPPNRLAKDIFGFVIDRNGMLIPIGSPSIGNGDDVWNNGCNDSVKNGHELTCTASIFANDRKVIYQD